MVASTANPPPSLSALLGAIESKTAPFAAQSIKEHQEVARQGRSHKELYISFFLNEIELALPIGSIQGVDRFPTVTPLPNLPPWILGIAHVRGEIISMVELRTLFKISYYTARRASFYILLRHGDLKLGFPVDRISGIVGVEAGEGTFRTSSASEDETVNNLSTYISGTLRSDERVLAILDSAKLLNSQILQKGIRSLEQVGEGASGGNNE
ncbi:chemotaxis protein CheW [Desulfogranum mediterraneum]|uniref:chemotaxis protein CheW n=1 Tax=Desulfogranum mediterraneum TaxID=160661 RepID=UPI00048B71DF|nr:chemotaxis protein CheW [Desulfogranum mediterraneum]